MSVLTTSRPVDGWAPTARDWHELFDRVGAVRPMSVLRIALGPITLLHLAPFLRDARAGIHYDDHFWHPYVPWAPHPPGELWSAVLVVGAVSAVLMSLGVLTRLTTATTFAVAAGNLLLSETHFRHNRAFLVILLGGLALLPTGRALSLDSWWRRVRHRPAVEELAPLWPVVLLRVQVSLVYLASGLSKLLDPDWVSGLVLWDRVVRYRHVLDPTPLPGWAVDVLTWRPLFAVVAPAAILVELFLAVGLWSARTRRTALLVAIVFHVSIEISASVEVFSYAAIAALAIWVTPATRDRTVRLRPGTGGARWLQRAARTLDWFARFRVEPARPGDPEITVVDRDGTTVEGRAAVLRVLGLLPVTFPLVPFLSLGAHRPGRRR